MNAIYPVGYSSPDAGAHIDDLMTRPEVLLVDTRLKPHSWNEAWRKEALEQKYGNRYRWAGKYLGNLGKDDGYIELADADTGIRGLVGYLDKQHDLILLCQCKAFEKCHVSTICRLLVEKMPEVEVVRPDNGPIQEWRYSVSDVAFEDVGDVDVPDEYQMIFNEYCAEMEWLTRPGTTITELFWCATECYYTNRYLEKTKHKAYTKSLLCSGDSKKIEAAVEAMKRLLLKWDSSRGIAKLNRDAYAAREQKKLRDKSDPKIRAWEQEVRRNPYYPDKESLESMKQREAQTLLERYQDYQQKWRSNGYPVPEPRMGDDGYMVVDMPEGWTGMQ